MKSGVYDPRGWSALEQRHVEVADPLARRRDPRQVQRLRLRVLERPHAVVELHQRRDREAQVRDVLGPEPQRDHSAQSKSIGARRDGGETLRPMERHLAWDGCSNVRDLGGLGRIRDGALVRADALQQLSAEGWRALERHGVRTVIDLRNPDEIGEDAAPRPPGLTTIRIPLDGMEDTEFWSQWLDRPEFGTPHYYGPWLERFPDRAARALAAIARAQPGGVAYHCGIGRDRTGPDHDAHLRRARRPRQAGGGGLRAERSDRGLLGGAARARRRRSSHGSWRASTRTPTSTPATSRRSRPRDSSAAGRRWRPAGATPRRAR